MQALSEGVPFRELLMVMPFLFGSGSQKKYKQSPDHYAIDNPLFEAIDQMYPEQNPYLAYHRWYRR